MPASSLEFGRIFPSLPPFAEANDTVRAALVEVGKPGGIMDAGDLLSAGPKALILDPSVNGNPAATNPYGTNPDNPTMTAGSTFVGQFVDHDITFDQTSNARGAAEPVDLTPTRARRGSTWIRCSVAGRAMRPDLYEKQPGWLGRAEAEAGAAAGSTRIPRVANGDGTYNALLGDPRNDESVIIAGLHCAHIMFYNRVLDELARA